jgi:tetratricopeptide (TPR) repeat protein
LSLASEDGVGNRSLGAAYNALGKHQDAIPPLRQAIRSLPNDVEASIELGIALDGAGLTQEAIAAFQMALQLGPESADARFRLGLALLKTGDVNAVEAEYHALQNLRSPLADKLLDAIR